MWLLDDTTDGSKYKCKQLQPPLWTQNRPEWTLKTRAKRSGGARAPTGVVLAAGIQSPRAGFDLAAAWTASALPDKDRAKGSHLGQLWLVVPRAAQRS